MTDHIGGGRPTAATPSHTPRQGASSASAGASTTGVDTAMHVLSYLLGGLLFYGGLGWFVDHEWHQAWALPTGLILGVGLSIYLIVRRFGDQR